MPSGNLEAMKSSVTPLPSGPDREERLARAANRRRDRRERSRGRAGINGREVGGTQPRFAHLTASYD